jgi:uncharacterized membrane protein (GlpM family)
MSARSNSLFGISLASLRRLSAKDLLLRFAFGATISAVAAVISITLGSTQGGILLAFPAILPATLTLTERDESERKAEDIDLGAIFGAVSLVVLAVVVWQFLPKGSAIVVLAAASAAWLVSAVLLYLGFRLVHHERIPLERALAQRSDPAKGR